MLSSAAATSRLLHGEVRHGSSGWGRGSCVGIVSEVWGVGCMGMCLCVLEMLG